MTNVLLTVSYDGTDFCGWQKQDSAEKVRTVQGELENALYKMFRTEIKVSGSGRTDSGVHALKQAANFFSPVDGIPEENFVRALNGILPRDVRISSAKKVDENFSARFSATSRCYRYFIQTGTQPFAHESRYRWFIPNRPEIHVLNSMAEILRGEMDFKTFAAAGDRSISTFRYVEDAFFFRDESNPDLLVFQIEANAFLWKMVRSLTGTLIRLEQKGSDSAEFKKILDRKDRKFSLFTAPPQGLFLWDVKFDGKRRHV